MQNKTQSTMSDDDLKRIYTDPELRNQVAGAHGCSNSSGIHQQFKTCSYPHTFIVSEEQIKEAQNELARAKTELINKYSKSGTLVFIGMGGRYESRYNDDPCNHRIRANFKNKKNKKCFIEFGTASDYESIRIDHAIINYDTDIEVNNYNGLERRYNLPRYTLCNILDLVNREFDCNFKLIIVDQYTLSPSDIISQAK